MPNIKPTKQVVMLADALRKRGVILEIEHWDRHKHVDIYIPAGRIYIEVDGVNHFTDMRQIMSDFQRDHYSDDDGFHTLRIPALVLPDEALLIAKDIKKTMEKFIV